MLLGTPAVLPEKLAVFDFRGLFVKLEGDVNRKTSDVHLVVGERAFFRLRARWCETSLVINIVQKRTVGGEVDLSICFCHIWNVPLGLINPSPELDLVV